jgi:hypothetical protein
MKATVFGYKVVCLVGEACHEDKMCMQESIIDNGI